MRLTQVLCEAEKKFKQIRFRMSGEENERCAMGALHESGEAHDCFCRFPDLALSVPDETLQKLWRMFPGTFKDDGFHMSKARVIQLLNDTEELSFREIANILKSLDLDEEEWFTEDKINEIRCRRCEEASIVESLDINEEE